MELTLYLSPLQLYPSLPENKMLDSRHVWKSSALTWNFHWGSKAYTVKAMDRKNSIQALINTVLCLRKSRGGIVATFG